MGWWEAPENKDIVIGDTILDMIRHFLKDFSKEYQEDMSRKPTVEELQYALNLGFSVNADDEILSDFETKEIKQVIIKTAQRVKRQKPKPGDIFCFKLDDERFGFGRVVSKVSIGLVVEIFDYISNQSFLNYSKTQSIMFNPIIIDGFSLFERRTEGDWRIIGNTPDYEPKKDYEKLRFVYGQGRDMTAADIYNNKMTISAEEAKKYPYYSPNGDYDVMKLIKEAQGR